MARIKALSQKNWKPRLYSRAQKWNANVDGGVLIDTPGVHLSAAGQSGLF